MKKLLLVFMSTLLIITSVLSFNAYYPDEYFKTTKIDGKNFTYRTIDNKGVEILEGEGFIPKEIEGLPVTMIGNRAYAGIDCVEYRTEDKIVIPDTVTYIDAGAFKYNYSIKSITIPSSVVYMGRRAFEGCNKLKSVKIGSGLYTIPGEAFQYCEKLETVKLADSVRYIEEQAFFNCIKLKSINIPKYLYGIFKDAFHGCIALKKMDFSDTSCGFFVKDKSIGFYGKYTEYGLDYGADELREEPVIKKIPGFRVICDPNENRDISKYAFKNKLNLTFNIKNNNNYFGEIGAGESVNITIDGKKPSKLITKVKKIVKIDQNGKVIGLKKGDTNITATMSDGKKYTGTFRVSDNPILKMKNKDGKYAVVKTVTVNKNKTVSVKIFGKATGVNNKYTNTSIAKVTSKNTATTLKIKGLKQGTTVLKISVNGVVLKLNVNVK